MKIRLNGAQVEESKGLDRAAASRREAEKRQREYTFTCGDCDGKPC